MFAIRTVLHGRSSDALFIIRKELHCPPAFTCLGVPDSKGRVPCNCHKFLTQRMDIQGVQRALCVRVHDHLAHIGSACNLPPHCRLDGKLVYLIHARAHVNAVILTSNPAHGKLFRAEGCEYCARLLFKVNCPYGRETSGHVRIPTAHFAVCAARKNVVAALLIALKGGHQDRHRALVRLLLGVGDHLPLGIPQVQTAILSACERCTCCDSLLAIAHSHERDTQKRLQRPFLLEVGH